MQPDWLIIDGYNLLHQTAELAGLLESDIHSARARLIRLAENTAMSMSPKTTIVFDGRTSGQDEALTSKHLEIFFSPRNLSADTVIERLVYKYPEPEKILVVTSDRAERETVSSAGAQTMMSQEFMARCDRDASRTIPKRPPPGSTPTLGDLFPEGW